MDTTLEKAATLYKAGDRQQASVLLSTLLNQQPDNASAWYGLALCLNEAEKKKYCLQKVINLNPDHEKARQALEKLSNNNDYKSCPYCSETIKSEDLFCSYCGRKLGQSTIPDSNDAVYHIEDEYPKGFQPRFLAAVAGLGV